MIKYKKTEGTLSKLLVFFGMGRRITFARLVDML